MPTDGRWVDYEYLAHSKMLEGYFPFPVPATATTLTVELLTTLEPQGHLLLLVPALELLYNDLDRLAGHHRRYSKAMMRDVLRGLPGQVKVMDYFNPIGGMALTP